MFALPQPTTAHVRTFNLRTEKHGDDDVTAMDLGMRVTGPNSMLDMIHPHLREMLYLPPDPAQTTIPGETPPWTELRCEAVASVSVSKYELIGRNVVLLPSSDIESEMRADDELAMGSCDVNKFVVTAYRGGSVDIDFRIQTNDIDGTAIGQAGAMLSQDVKLQVTHTEIPDEAPAPSDDKKVALEKDAGTLFAEAHGGDKLVNGTTLSETAAWPFPGQGTDAGAPPQHLTEPKTTKAQRKRDDAAKAH